MRALLPAVLVIATAAVAARAAGEPSLVPATLRSVSPTGFVRGSAVTVTLDGLNIGPAPEVIVDDPAIAASVEPGGSASRVRVRLQISGSARAGIHSLFLRTPLGATGSVPFHLAEHPEVRENESAAVQETALPATLVGKMDQPGDRDAFAFTARAGDAVVIDVVAARIRSRLSAVISLHAPDGRMILSRRSSERSGDVLAAATLADAGRHTLIVSDLESAAGGDVHYRIVVGPGAVAEQVFPLGFPPSGGTVNVRGIGWPHGAVVPVPPGPAEWEVVEPGFSDGPRPAGPVRVMRGEGLGIVEAEPNDTAATATSLIVPGGASGILSRPHEADHFRIRARKGERLSLEVHGRRLGTPIDSHVEVLDSRGKPIETAALRCIAETALTLSDRDSASTGLRLLTWSDFAVHDLVYVRGEVIQLVGLPRGPDDDARFRAVRGQRLGLFGTTPSGHAVNAPIYKVQAHPPGTQFPPNGMPVFRLYARNDDGGPLFGKDSHLLFDPPADGDYVVRVTDTQGGGGPNHGYLLTVRPARPDFTLSLSPAHPSVPAGARVPVDVNIDRMDGFDGEVRVRLQGLPAGVEATETTIEAGENSATLLLSASPGAAVSAPVDLRLVGETGAGSGRRVREFRLNGGQTHLVVLPEADLRVRTDVRRLALAPGGEVALEAAIERLHGFDGRVPIDVRNLPFGVRVNDVGLNGVLITESERSRRFTLVAEPWVRPMQRLVYCTVKTETASAAPTDVGAEPIVLEIVPAVSRQP